MQPLRRFITRFASLLATHPAEPVILAQGKAWLAELVAADDWLPPAYATPHPDHYQSYLLHCDSTERFSIQSFVWGPGQATPVHDHTVWGLIGVLRGAELNQPYRHAGSRLEPNGPAQYLGAGAVEAVSPTIGDIHKVSNAFLTKVSVSIHVYGGNLAAIERNIYDMDGSTRLFTSGYADMLLPNVWR